MDAGRMPRRRGGLPDGETRLVALRDVGLEDGAAGRARRSCGPKAGRIALHLFQDVLDGHDGLPKTGFYFDPGRFPARWGITHEKSSAPSPAAAAAAEVVVGAGDDRQVAPGRLESEAQVLFHEREAELRRPSAAFEERHLSLDVRRRWTEPRGATP